MMRTLEPVSAQAKIRVVVVDDSATVRGFFMRWFDECDDLECVGAAANGLEAISMIPAARPDIVILDIEMPHMNGLEALPLIRIGAPNAAIIIASRLTRKNAELTLRCLQGGACEVLPKPQAGGEGDPLEEFRREMLQKVRALARAGSRSVLAPQPVPPPQLAVVQPSVAQRPAAKPRAPHPSARPTPPAATPSRIVPIPMTPIPMTMTRPRVIVIGASTGGPNACAELVAAIKPVIAQVPVVIAQHMPPVFTRVFSEHLAAATGVPCREATNGEPLLRGQVYVGPGGHHVTIAGSQAAPALAIDERPPVHFSRPSVDLLFISARDMFGAQAVGVVLTGMGSDGLDGARAMAAGGARIYAQDEASSVVWGMPGAVARAGLTQDVLPPSAIGAALQKAFGR